MRTKSVVFRIETCQDDSPVDGAGYCKSEQEILDFTNNLSVQLWVVDSYIDLRYLKDESYSRDQRLLSEASVRMKDEIPSD